MADIIRRHNFDQALRKLNQLSSSRPSVPSIDKFDTKGGLFKCGKHYINGEEMNDFVEKIKDYFSSQNIVHIGVLNEVREIYNTLNFLDNEYLQGIVCAVDAANKASEGAKMASDQAKDAAIRALRNEEDIRKEVEALKKVVEKIKSIRDDLNTKISQIEKSVNDNRKFFIQEIYKITVFYSDIQNLKNELNTIKTLHEDNTFALGDLKQEGDARHLELSQRIDKLGDTVEAQHEESLQSLNGLKQESDARNLALRHLSEPKSHAGEANEEFWLK